ncbi:MAG: hypothetical protein ACLP5J_08965 [Mycobacterium sp.]|uniref:hypothetical protein n=1 Tax=Mycobacterium sp. TaxID=1785 RepID=UPI003F9724E8
MAREQIPPPPAGLAARGKALWRQIHQDFELDALESELLTELCRTLDCCDQLQAELKGLKSLAVLGSAGQWRAHPLLTALDVQRKTADRLAGSLGLSMPGSSGVGKARGHQRKAARVRWAGKAAPLSIAGA